MWKSYEYQKSPWSSQICCTLFLNRLSLLFVHKSNESSMPQDIRKSVILVTCSNLSQKILGLVKNATSVQCVICFHTMEELMLEIILNLNISPTISCIPVISVKKPSLQRVIFRCTSQELIKFSQVGNMLSAFQFKKIEHSYNLSN